VSRNTREIAWIRAARKEFEAFPDGAKDDLLDALSAIAEGQRPVIAKPLVGLGPDVLELALRHLGDAYRVVYALRIGPEIWVVHAFKKKSKSGIATPKQEIDLIRDRLKRLKEASK
jgi:phage-related protein